MQGSYQKSVKELEGRRLTVMTPEQVELRFETAGIGGRAGAQIIDSSIILLVNAAVVLAGWAAMEAMGTSLPAWAAEYAYAAMVIFYGMFAALYFIIGEYVSSGQTIGKRAMGIRVIQENGRTLSFLSSVTRNLFRLIDMLPILYFAGILFSFFHGKDKRIGDMAAGTVVVYEQGGMKRRRNRMEKLLKKYQMEIPVFSLESWIRERVTDKEWALLSAFAERLGTLAPMRAYELAEEIVELLAPKLELTEQWDAARMQLSDDIPILWALGIYTALHEDWELPALGGDSYG